MRSSHTTTDSSLQDQRHTHQAYDSATPLLVNSKVASAMLALGERTLWSLTNRNAIPSRKIGRAVRYSPAELRSWIEAGCPTESGAAVRIQKAAGR